jgi:hypothetical protein
MSQNRFLLAITHFSLTHHSQNAVFQLQNLHTTCMSAAGALASLNRRKSFSSSSQTPGDPSTSFPRINGAAFSNTCCKPGPPPSIDWSTADWRHHHQMRCGWFTTHHKVEPKGHVKRATPWPDKDCRKRTCSLDTLMEMEVRSVNLASHVQE